MTASYAISLKSLFPRFSKVIALHVTASDDVLHVTVSRVTAPHVTANRRGV